MASRQRGELVLATIGPETNIALALRREPRLRHWLAEIAVMGGSTGNGMSRQRQNGIFTAILKPPGRSSPAASRSVWLA
jgi:hypothetical protein